MKKVKWKRICGKALMILLVFGVSPIVPAQTATAPPARRDRTLTKTQQQDPEADVIRVDTNLVNTLFTAVDEDRHFVTTLKAQDIRIFENDVPQAISVFERETNRPLALAILIDTSESQVGVLEREKRAARVFVDQVLRPNMDQATIISFTGNPRVEEPLTNDRSRLHAGIAQVARGLSPENQYRMANDLDPLPKEQDSTGYTGIWDAAWETLE